MVPLHGLTNGINLVSCHAWYCFLGGTDTGVMKHVGEAVKHRGSVGNVGRSKISVIGIAPWGVLESPHCLISKVSMKQIVR